MAKAKYRTPDFKAAKAAADAAQARGEWLECKQPTCLRPTRAIAPSDPIDIAHNDAGDIVLGPAHRRCNRADGGKRRHQATHPHRWAL